MIEAELRSLLLTFDALTALVGERIFADEIPQLEDGQDEEDLFPCLVFQLDRETPQNDLEGVSGLVNGQISLRAFSALKSTARSVMEAVRVNGTDPGTGLAGYHGLAGSTVIDAVHDDTLCERWALDDGTDSGLYCVTGLYTLCYPQPV